MSRDLEKSLQDALKSLHASLSHIDDAIVNIYKKRKSTLNEDIRMFYECHRVLENEVRVIEWVNNFVSTRNLKWVHRNTALFILVFFGVAAISLESFIRLYQAFFAPSPANAWPTPENNGPFVLVLIGIIGASTQFLSYLFMKYNGYRITVLTDEEQEQENQNKDQLP